jgi:phage terminase large subunit
MLLRRLLYPRTPGLILRRTFPELQKSHILKLFEEYPTVRRYYNEQKKCLTFPNGSTLFFGSARSADDMGDYYSAEFADIMVDEAQEFSQRELESLSGSNRCTSNFDITPKMIMTFMPGTSESGAPPKGLSYLKRVFVDGELKGQETNQTWAFVQAFSWDNIEWARKELQRDGIDEIEFYSWTEQDRRDYYLTRTEYGRTLLAITDPYLRDAWLYGKWDIFQGQYFPNFKPEKHVISQEQFKAWVKPWFKRWLSGDWGVDHPGVIYWHAQDEHGRVVTYREHWARGMGESELGKRIGELTAGEKPVAFPYSWDAFGKLSKGTRKSITELIGAAMPPNLPKPTPADSSPGSRISGWRLMSQLFDADMWQMTEDCTHLIECIPSLIKDGKNTEDVLKVDFPENNIGDDPADAARYGLQYMLGSTRKPASEVLREQAMAIEDPLERTYFWLKNRDKASGAHGMKKPENIPGWMNRLK